MLQTSTEVRVTRPLWTTWPQWVAHQCAWWAAVLWMGWLGPAAMGVFIGIHLWVMRAQLRRETEVILAAAFIGVAVDGTLNAIDAVRYVGDLRIAGSPVWLVSIWAGFGATLRHSQAVLVQSPLVAATVGLLGGPAAYWGGERLARMQVSGGLGWIAVAATWSIALLLLHYTARRAGRDD